MSDLSDYHEKNNLIGRINHQEELINRLLNENKNLTNELSSANKKIKSRERSLRNAKSASPAPLWQSMHDSKLPAMGFESISGGVVATAPPGMYLA